MGGGGIDVEGLEGVGDEGVDVGGSGDVDGGRGVDVGGSGDAGGGRGVDVGGSGDAGCELLVSSSSSSES